MKQICFIDTEVSPADNKAHDFGAVNENNQKIHTGSSFEFHQFISGSEYLCGHNVIHHDSNYIKIPSGTKLIDTLYLSPLMFPNKPYHALVKDEKLNTDELNNPLNDAIKAMTLFYDEVNAFFELDDELKTIYHLLLNGSPYFSGFFDYIGDSVKSIKDVKTADDSEDLIQIPFCDFPPDRLKTAILQRFSGEICANAPITDFIVQSPVELAYCIALISATQKESLIPRWVFFNFPKVSLLLQELRNTSCHQCAYCRTMLNPTISLRKYFGYPEFRTYNGEPLQENAVNAALEHKSLLAIFPTGGGKSLTFQIPALISGETQRALTVIISPLQSLMKDQVDNLERKGITQAVTINGLLSPLERAEAIERVESGLASILYISPESLRSVTIERLFLSRLIDRFVIDEAHCFSAWGQDFRVDYLYIGDFIRELQEKKGNGIKIPVSCFTATAKQKVISDIKDYFKNKLNLELELFATNASRTNLRYEVLYKETDEEKYETLRSLIEQKQCPTIVYVSRTKKTVMLAQKLIGDGFLAGAFNGNMTSTEKQENQEAFIHDRIQIMVATSAFGMGVDKSNVKLVVHYDISDSLENYVQEAGRAGRDETIQAECYVLFNDGDLDQHFLLLNQTKLSISEIQQVWKAIKDLTRIRPFVCCSPLEVARQAGWDENVKDIETRVRTAILALENAGYVKRGKNVPRVYATSILVKNMTDATNKINSSLKFENDEERTIAKRIISSLISSKSISDAGNADAESRVDYLADRLGIEKSSVIQSVQKMREDGLLSDSKDLTAYIQKTDTTNKSLNVLHKFQSLETFLLDYLDEKELCTNYKELNEAALAAGIRSSSVNAIKTLFYYWTIRNYIRKEQDSSTNRVTIIPTYSIRKIKEKRFLSYQLSEFVIHYLFEHSASPASEKKDEVLVGFSVLELMNAYDSYRKKTMEGRQNPERKNVKKQEQSKQYDHSEKSIEESLLFLSKIGALRLEGGFLVLYNGMQIQRMILDNKIRYKLEDYKQLNEFYQQKIQQIHIVGEYANMMVRSYTDALQFVNDYFQMDYKKFLSHYFSGSRTSEIERNITPKKYRQLFDTLSSKQLEIIRDDSSKYIVVTAGPGSGKTRVLVHKLASLLLLEDVKHEQLLMLTFSRAAVMEFQQRLKELIGNAAHFVEIKTFHSYCFDLLGKIGNIENADNIVEEAGRLLKSEDVDLGKITKTVLVIDEAQDMDCHEFALIEALMERNDDMRVIAVGDDDQNIYQFRGSDSKYMKALITKYGACQYSLTENYRSYKNIVSFSNQFVRAISMRMKNTDIIPHSSYLGEVKLIRHSGDNLEHAIFHDIADTHLNGTTCVLTNTNEDAMKILCVLEQHKIPAKLIQSIDGFDIYDIAEIRYFLKQLATAAPCPVISTEQWNSALIALQKRYKNSSCLSMVLNILNAFDMANEKKYRTDFELFLHESKIEDFEQCKQGIVTISTIHKSKGREFDNVFILLNHANLNTDGEKRTLYVGMTRAKQLLHIHYNTDILDSYCDAASLHETDPCSYPKACELVLQLSHKDVYLDYFKDKQLLIQQMRMRSGMHLLVYKNKMYVRTQEGQLPVLQLSTKCYEEVKKYIAKGYTPNDAVIRFICGWKGKDDTKETAVILADLHLFLKEK
ncbi:MAG: RecQ family ATP-dependent DNA helicase [Lachnospiraceae bacterium]|nr:RecQ family ATP-dependent DNA helicase [Lachnospiraceae bacterium]